MYFSQFKKYLMHLQDQYTIYSPFIHSFIHSPKTSDPSHLAIFLFQQLFFDITNPTFKVLSTSSEAANLCTTFWDTNQNLKKRPSKQNSVPIG